MKKVLLCVLDGFGEGPDYKGNAITRANTPTLKKIRANSPWTLLEASGEAVGIPAGNQGGSEVGHLTMGAGRIILQPLQAINQSIQSGEFFEKTELLKAAKHCKENDSTFHILGMISDQGVHSDIKHAIALLDFAKAQGLSKVFVHGITDGRDVPPKSVGPFIETLEAHMEKIGLGKIATLVGRNFAMDRDKNLERTEAAYKLFTKGAGRIANNPKEAVEQAYASGLESDYFFEPTLIDESGLMNPEDAVVFFNFRTDRAAQLTKMIEEKLKAHLLIFGAYSPTATNLFPPQKVKNSLGEVISDSGLKQLRAAETEKFAHVTFFFNSQAKEPFHNEDRLMVASHKCELFNEKPEMSAMELTDKLLPELDKDYAFIAINYANLDLVGHSGEYEATVTAVECIDACLGKLIPSALENDYTVLITGDHGNAEHMLYEDSDKGDPSHTRNPVPLYIVSNEDIQLKTTSHTEATGGLADLAPSILSMMDLAIPNEMTGQVLVK